MSLLFMAETCDEVAVVFDKISAWLQDDWPSFRFGAEHGAYGIGQVADIAFDRRLLCRR